MEKIIKNNISDVLVELGFKNSQYNINLIYAEHLNDINDRAYKHLIRIYSHKLEK